MRKIKTTSLLPALLCGAALLAFGCNQGEEQHAGQVEKPAPTQIAQTPAPAPKADEKKADDMKKSDKMEKKGEKKGKKGAKKDDSMEKKTEEKK